MDVFDEIPGDAVVITDIMASLGLSRDDFHNPTAVEMFKDVVAFFGKLQPLNRASVFDRILSGKQDKLKIAFEYVHLVKQLEEVLQKSADAVSKHTRLLAMDEDTQAVRKEIEELKSKENFLRNELELYEKR